MSNEVWDEINEKMDRVVAYLHFSNLGRLKEELPKILDTETKILIYVACDGATGINEMARKTGIIPMTVSNNVKKFEQQGIIISKSFGTKKFPVKIVELDLVGLKVPKTKPTKAKKDNQEGATSVGDNRDVQ